jgi:REP element-mobilizing transposase RayT
MDLKIRNQFKAHVVIFTVVDWVDVFSHQMYRNILIDSFTYCQNNKGLIVFGYCIMSNQVHAILQSKQGELSKTIGELKRHCAKTILKTIQDEPEDRKDWMLKRFEFAAQGTNNNEIFKFWKNGNHPEEIVSEKFFWSSLNDVHMKPVRTGIVKKAHHYIYCSASNYILNEGLMDIKVLAVPSLFDSDQQLKIDYDLW